MICLNELLEILAFPGSDEQFRKYIQYREPLKEPLPPLKWWSKAMNRLRELHPKSSTYELSSKLRNKWYSLPKDRQERIRRSYTRRTGRYLELAIDLMTNGSQ